MTYSVFILRRAQRDVIEILDWLSSRSAMGALRWHAVFLAATTLLQQNAESLALAPESTDLNRAVRQAFFKTRHGRRYRILFTIVDDTVRSLCVRAPGQSAVRPEDLTN